MPPHHLLAKRCILPAQSSYDAALGSSSRAHLTPVRRNFGVFHVQPNPNSNIKDPIDLQPETADCAQIAWCRISSAGAADVETEFILPDLLVFGLPVLFPFPYSLAHPLAFHLRFEEHGEFYNASSCVIIYLALL